MNILFCAFQQPPIYLKAKSSYGPPKASGGWDFGGSASTQSFATAPPPKPKKVHHPQPSFRDSVTKGFQSFSDSIAKGSQTFTTYSKPKQNFDFGDSPSKGSHSTSYEKRPQTFQFQSSYGSPPKDKPKKSSSSSSSSYGKTKGPSFGSYETGTSYRGETGGSYRGGNKGKQQKGHGGGGSFLSSLVSSFNAGFGSHLHGHGHSSKPNKPKSKSKGHQDLVHSASSYGPPQFSKVSGRKICISVGPVCFVYFKILILVNRDQVFRPRVPDTLPPQPASRNHQLSSTKA